MNKKFLIILLSLCILFPIQSFAVAGGGGGDPGPSFCANKDFRSDNNIFQDYQNSEYVNGLLRINFKLQNSVAYQNFYLNANLFDSECNSYGDDYYDWGNPPIITFLPYTVNFSLRFITPTHFVIWNNDTNSRFDCSICDIDFSSYGYPDNLQASFFITDYYGYNRVGSYSLPIIEPKPIVSKTPILIVPGIMGTEMFDGSEKLWVDLNRMSYTIGDSFMDPLGFNDNLTPSNTNVFSAEVISVAKLFGADMFNYTTRLKEEHIGQGSIENETLFTFPYDWRYGVSGKFASGETNVDLLKNKIDEILAQTGASKVDIIAHSMGGLITKKYVIDNFTTDTTTHKINKAVFVGVPNTGAPEAIKTLIQGSNMGIPFLNDAEVKKISENMPASYDLLPSQKYYDVSGSFAKVFYTPDIFDPDWKPGTTVLPENVLDYQEFGNYITEDKNLNSTAFNNSTTLHTQAFDDFDLRTAGVDVYRIAGCKTGTIANIKETRFVDTQGNTTASNYAITSFDIGDGTVPIQSATNLPVDDNKKFYALASEHGKMLSQDGTRQQITNIIAGSTLSTGKNFWGNNLITQDVNNCQLNGKAIEVFSPVDIFVTDQFGNKLGLAEDKSIINEIPNASFEILGEQKFIYLPTDNNQTYTINMQGTGTGTYTINVKDIQNTTEAKTETFSNLPVTTSLTGTVNLGDIGSPITLTIKETPTSQAVVIYPGDYTQDTIAPEVVIEFDPIKKDLKFTGKDNLSLSSEITITDKDDIITLTDKAGNTTEIKLKDKNRKITMKAEIKSIKYNGKLADTSKNKMAFLWLFDKKGKLTMLSQYVSSKKDYNVLAVYNGKNTTLLSKDSSGRIMKTEKGLKILKIATNNGDLSWGY
jgi:hypothetical protein